MTSFDKVKKPAWKHPFTWGLVDGFGDGIKLQSEVDSQLMVENLVEMSRACEDEMYIKFITEVLASKGYEVKKIERFESGY